MATISNVQWVNGNLVIYDPSNTAVWSSNSPTVGCPRLVLQNDGNLVIYGTTAASWSNGARVNKMIKEQVHLNLDTAIALESLTFKSPERREAVAAFREKRAPNYTGR